MTTSAKSATGIPALDLLMEREDVRQGLQKFAIFLHREESGRILFQVQNGRVMQAEATEITKFTPGAHREAKQR